MKLNKFSLGLIGQYHPEIYDVLGNTFGRSLRNRGEAASLNPQPLPPVAPGLAAGFEAAAELVRLAFTAHYLEVPFNIAVAEWCNTHPRILPPLPPGTWPPDPEPWPIKDDGFDRDYLLGLAFSLEVSESAWRDLRVADVLARVHATAFDRVNLAAINSHDTKRPTTVGQLA